MRAIVQDRYGSAEVLELREIAAPEPTADQVRVKVQAAGLDAGVWHLMAGIPYLIRIMGYGLRRPKFPVIGMDFAGVVDAVGEKVTEFRDGDAVYGVGQGSFAEQVCVKPANLAPKPASLDFVQAAAVPTSGCTALQALRDQGGIEAGQSVLVIGAGGGVGSFAVQLAKSFGAEVTGVCSTSKVETVRKLGADHVIDYTSESITDSGKRHDLIVDTAGRRPVAELRRALATRGTLVFVGGEDGGKFFGGMGRPIGGVLLSLFVKQRLRFFVATARTPDLEFLTQQIEEGRLSPLVDRTFPLAEAPQAVARWAEGHARGKAVVQVASA